MENKHFQSNTSYYCRSQRISKEHFVIENFSDPLLREWSASTKGERWELGTQKPKTCRNDRGC